MHIFLVSAVKLLATLDNCNICDKTQNLKSVLPPYHKMVTKMPLGLTMEEEKIIQNRLLKQKDSNFP